MKRITLLLLILFTICSSSLYSQKSEWIVYERTPQINKMFEYGGYLWGSTYAGLVRINKFTGERKFYHELNSGLMNNNVSDMVLDSSGNLWFSYSSYSSKDTISTYGITKYNIENDEWTSFHESQFPQYSNKLCLTGPLGVDTDNNLLICMIERGFAKFDGVEFTNIYNFEISEYDYISKLVLDK